MINQILSERDEMIGSEVQEQTGMLQTVKERINMNNLVEQLHQSKDMLIEVGLYACVGFFAGYLLKRYSSFLAMVVLCIAGLVALNQIELVAITINWARVYEFFGIQPALITTDNLFALVWEWIRMNALIVSSTVIGFLVGLRVG